jgi:beta-galactosidase/beta-glucuronidase
MGKVYRTEYPNPQFERKDWTCLNGEWEFEIGEHTGKTNCALSGKIVVPFCPESELSGVGFVDFIPQCTYSKKITVTEEDVKDRLVLHFGAVDYKAVVYCNGVGVITHEGGYTPFEADIAPFVTVGENRITVCVFDDITANVPSGKQSDLKESYGCYYTRTTGIWQSVWLERTPKSYIKWIRFFPDPENASVKVEISVEGVEEKEIALFVEYQGRKVGEATRTIYHRGFLDVHLSEKHLWEIDNGRLYDVKICFGEDIVYSYFGLRSVRYEGKKFLLNEKNVYQRLVLDQGYYRRGIYTAETEEELKKDIILSKNLGFNGARLHQKVFEPRFLYHCDKMGYIVWGEYPSWGMHYYDLSGMVNFIREWTEAVERDFNHPSIVTWCPLNEAWMDFQDAKKARDIRFVESIYGVTKALDFTRPCVDVSGGYHGKYTDLYDIHCYFGVKELAEEIEFLEKGIVRFREDYLKAPETLFEKSEYDGKSPLNISEYGGVSYQPDAKGWGYLSTENETEFIQGYVERTKLLLECPLFSGFCYTQLYDVEQEQNGLYTYDRKPKFPCEKIYPIFSKKAAIEEE